MNYLGGGGGGFLSGSLGSGQTRQRALTANLFPVRVTTLLPSFPEIEETSGDNLTIAIVERI
jgi:hypothetical protein